MEVEFGCWQCVVARCGYPSIARRMTLLPSFMMMETGQDGGVRLIRNAADASTRSNVYHFGEAVLGRGRPSAVPAAHITRQELNTILEKRTPMDADHGVVR